MTGVLRKRGHLGTEMHIEERLCGETQDEDSHLQVKEGDVDQIFLSELSEGTNPADTSLFWTFTFQNCEAIHSYCSSPVSGTL